MKNNICRHCGSALFVKQTHRTPQQLKKQYYYTAYYFCPSCKRIYHSDEFKVVNENYDLFNGVHDDAGEPVEVEIWTDGACVNNGAENAKAAWAFVSGEYELAGIVSGKQTNNRAEAQAILEALSWAGEKGYKKIKIYADTLITLQSLKKPLTKIKANTDIFEKIFQIIDNYKLNVVYEKVLGHSGVLGNERVDKLANNLSKNLFKLSE